MATPRLPTRVALAAVGSALVLGLAACSDDEGHMGADGSMMGGSRAASTAPAPAADHDRADVMFSMMMVPHHLQAIEMSDLAPTRSTDPELLALARQIKAAQQPEVDTMTAWLASWGAEPMMGHEQGAPPWGDMAGMGGMGGMMTADQLRELGALEGEAFDRRWLEMMVEHHEGAVDMAEAVIAAGSHAPTRALAVAIIEAQQTEIAQMRAMLAG
jgi:uncharacterized protein (DUF305 family)